MKQLKHLLASVLFLVPLGLAAHPGHGNEEPVTQEQAALNGDRVVVALVQSNKLAASWQGRAHKAIETRQTSVGPIWVVSYENAAESDKAKQTLYLFFDEYGGFIGGNHTGKF